MGLQTRQKLSSLGPLLAIDAPSPTGSWASHDFDGRIVRRVYPEVVGLCDSSVVFAGQAHTFYR